jgi:hypothetical protein
MTPPPSSARLKAALVLGGVRIDPSLARPPGPAPASVDFELPDGAAVSAPVATDQQDTPFVLAVRAGRSMVETDDGGNAVPVVQQRGPRFAERPTTQGTPMGRIGTLRGRHLVISPGGACGFGVRGTPCPFCLEGARAMPSGAARVHPTEVVEVVRAAMAERRIDSVYLNSCAFDADDGGIVFLAPYVEAIRRHVDALVAIQVHPPATTQWVERTYAMGVDAISYNLEIFDPDVLLRQCVGRARYIGRDRYLEVLAHAARVFPDGAVWCELVVGIEPAESTRAGIDALAAMGVVPLLVLHRGAAGANGRTLDDVDALCAHLVEATARAGLNTAWVGGLPAAIGPGEAGQRGSSRLLPRHRMAGFLLRNLARTRRRLRVRKPDDASPGGH